MRRVIPPRAALAAGVAAAALVIVSCSSTDGAEPSSPGDPALLTSPTALPSSVSIIEAAVSHSANAPLAGALHLVFDVPAQVDVTARSGDHVVAVPRTAAMAASHDIPIIGMRADLTYEISVSAVVDGTVIDTQPTAGGDAFEFVTPPLPDWFPQHQVTLDASRAAPGYTLVESAPNGYGEIEGAPDNLLIAYDDAGEVAWYYTNFGGLGGVEQTERGTFLSHYWPFGIREFDVLGNVINNWRPTISAGDGADSPDVAPEGNPGDAAPIEVVADWVELRSFHHENWPMPNGNVLALSTTLHALTPEQRELICPGDPAEFDAISDVIVEFTPDGTVQRTWDVWDVIDIVEHPGSAMCEGGGLFADTLARDWTHANSVTYDVDRDAVIVSVRHTDQILAFDHLDDLGPQSHVRWILGAGATMPLDGSPTFHQHAVEVLDDGGIVVYDNGNGRPGTAADDPDHPPFSRAVIFDIDDSSDDPADWSASQRWEHIALDDDGGHVSTEFIGDADVLENGNVLITHGGIGTFPPVPEDPLHALVIEVVPTGSSGGDIVWQLTTDPTSGHTIYRSEHITSFYP